MVSASFFLISLAAVAAYAAPAKRQNESQDNGSCRALRTICDGSVAPTLSDAWNHKACLFGAACFDNSTTNVDDFLAAVWADRGFSGAAPKSVSLPRVTSSVSIQLITLCV